MNEKRIANIGSLEEILSNENSSWKEAIFERLGVIVLPTGCEQYKWDLISACGYTDMDPDYDADAGAVEEVTIHNTEELVDYIQSLSRYHTILKNVKLGAFCKADLFWAVYYRILSQNTYKGSDGEFVYGLRAISGPTKTWNNDENELWFDTSVCGVDELAGTYVQLSGKETLDDVVNAVANQIRMFRENWEDDNPPAFSYLPDVPYTVPNNYSEVLAAYHKMQY